MESAEPRRDDPVPTLLAIATAGGAAYLGYQYVYVPWKVQQALNTQVSLVQAKNPGMSRADAINTLGTAGCQGAALYFGGIPPQLSAGVCSQAGSVAQAAVKLAPGLVNFALNTTGKAATVAGKGVKAIGTGVGGGVAAAGKGVANAAVSVGLAPIRIVGGTLAPVGKVAKNGAKAIGKFFGKIF